MNGLTVNMSEDSIMLIVPLLKKVMRYIQGGKHAFVLIAELRLRSEVIKHEIHRTLWRQPARFRYTEASDQDSGRAVTG